MELKLKNKNFIVNGEEKILTEAFERNLAFHISQANKNRIFTESLTDKALKLKNIIKGK